MHATNRYGASDLDLTSGGGMGEKPRQRDTISQPQSIIACDSGTSNPSKHTKNYDTSGSTITSIIIGLKETTKNTFAQIGHAKDTKDIDFTRRSAVREPSNCPKERRTVKSAAPPTGAKNPGRWRRQPRRGGDARGKE